MTTKIKSDQECSVFESFRRAIGLFVSLDNEERPREINLIHFDIIELLGVTGEESRKGIFWTFEHIARVIESLYHICVTFWLIIPKKH